MPFSSDSCTRLSQQCYLLSARSLIAATLLILLRFTLGAPTLLAQESTYGVRAGANFSNFNSDDKDYDAAVGYHGYFYVRRFATDYFAFQPEFGVSLVGSDELGITSIDVGLMGQFFALDYIYLQGGIQPGYLLPNEKDEDEPFEVQDFNVSVPIGFGVMFTNLIGAEARYNLGLSRISKNDDKDVRMNTFQLGVTLNL